MQLATLFTQKTLFKWKIWVKKLMQSSLDYTMDDLIKKV